MDRTNQHATGGRPVSSSTSATPRIGPPAGARLRLLAYLLALAFLIYVLKKLHPEQALRDVRHIRWGWVAVGIALDLLSYVVQGERWRLLLSSFSSVRLTQTVRCIYSGLFANEILPLRSGELLRAFLIARDTRIGLTRVLTTIGLERLMDGIVLAAALGVVSMYVSLPGKFAGSARFFGAFMLLLALCFVAGVIYLHLVPVLPQTAHPLRKRIREKLAPFLEGVRMLGSARGTLGAAAVSPLIPILQIFALWSMGRAYDIGLSVWPMAAVLLIINFGVAIPNAPANIGSYQFFCTLGLTLFGVEEGRAAGFSIVVYLLLTIPFLLLGCLAVVRSGISVGSLREKVSEIVERPPQAG